MTNRLFRTLYVVSALAASVLTGCRSSNAYDVNTPMPERVLLTVKNDNFLDVDIYAVSSGLATRIGTVTGLNTQSFALNSSLWQSGDFRIIGAPIGGNGRATSGPLSLHSDSEVTFTIGSVLRQSHAEVR